ncbi:hypothetical protein ACFOLK_17450 [Marinococcus halophilus]
MNGSTNKDESTMLRVMNTFSSPKRGIFSCQKIVLAAYENTLDDCK